jgi:hypothetical protein
MKAWKIVLHALAAIDALCAAALIWAAVAFFRSGQEEENAGAALLAVVLMGLGLFTLAAAAWLLSLARKPVVPRHATDPQREVAIYVNSYTYFALFHPWLAHQPDTRYQLRDAAGNVKEFRLRCTRNGPCTVKNATEQELRAAVSQMLPPCPAPPDR